MLILYRLERLRSHYDMESSQYLNNPDQERNSLPQECICRTPRRAPYSSIL